MNLNKVIIIGRLTKDPELRSTNSGNSVANFSMATNRYWTNDTGEKQEETEFHNIVIWGRRAEIVNQFLNKGSLAMVEGRLQTRKWEDKNGNNRYTTEIVAENVQFGPKKDNDRPAPPQTKRSSKKKEVKDEDLPEIDLDDVEDDINPDDIPF